MIPNVMPPVSDRQTDGLRCEEELGQHGIDEIGSLKAR